MYKLYEDSAKSVIDKMSDIFEVKFNLRFSGILKFDTTVKTKYSGRITLIFFLRINYYKHFWF